MKHADSQVRWLDVQGWRIHCLTAGESGSPVMLLHGGGLDSAMLSWGEVMAPLSAHHCVFAPDLPGYGLSDRPDLTYTIDFFVNIVEQLLDALQIEKVCLGGLSMGGGIALAFALRFPARVDKLILVDTYGIQEKVAAHRFSYFYVHLPLLDELSYWLISRSRFLVRQMLLAGLIYDPQRLSSELVDQVYQVARAPHAGRAFISMQRDDLLWHGLKTNFIGMLHEITIPTLLIHGAKDAGVPLACAERAHALIPNSELVILHDCRHWAQREKPAEFCRAVENFLDVDK